MVHLGVGNFHRAHQAWYTANSPDADQWGIAAFTGRRTDMADALKPQDGLYTLITRSGEGDSFELIGALSAVHGAVEHETYLDYLSRRRGGDHHHHCHRGRPISAPPMVTLTLAKTSLCLI